MKHYIISTIIALTLVFLSTSTLAKGKEKSTNHGFYEAAKKYDKAASKENDSARANDFKRLAEIKRNAGKLADQNRWKDINWNEYEKISARLENKGK